MISNGNHLLGPSQYPPSTYAQYLQQQLQIQQIQQSPEIVSVPAISKQRVSERLLENKIRRTEIDFQKQLSKQNLVRKRKQKQRQININLENILKVANEFKEINIRESCSQKHNRERDDEEIKKEMLQKYRQNLQKIEKGRLKIEEKKSEYVFRIHKRISQKFKQVKERKKLMISLQEKSSNQIHLKEWNQYKNKLMQKHLKQKRSSPDHLYQEFMQTRNRFHNFHTQINKETHQTQTEVKTSQQSQIRIIKTNASTRSLISQNKKVEYFGIHQQDMIKKTTKDIKKMRIFVEQHSVCLNPSQDEHLLQRFQAFIFKEIL